MMYIQCNKKKHETDGVWKNLKITIEQLLWLSYEKILVSAMKFIVWDWLTVRWLICRIYFFLHSQYVVGVYSDMLDDDNDLEIICLGYIFVIFFFQICWDCVGGLHWFNVIFNVKD